MAAKVVYADGELVSTSLWVPSPLAQGNVAPSTTRSSRPVSTGSLRCGDWRRFADLQAGTDGDPAQASPRDYLNETPNIDDMHSPASVNFDNGMSPRLGVPSPLIPRALAASTGCIRTQGPGRSAGRMAVIPQPSSPSSMGSLGEGEASFRLEPQESGEDQFPGIPRSDVSPVRPRRAMPVESELSTPGSDGYASPSVLYAIPPSSRMRSSVQNPLYVDRPTPSEECNDVAKALVLSPCTERSQLSRLPRSTIESGWSSSSPEQSISLNPSQHDDTLSPAAHMEAASPLAGAAARWLMPSLTLVEGTPRTMIKRLSMTPDLPAAGHAASPRAQHAGTDLQDVSLQLHAHSSLQRASFGSEPITSTPCSAAWPVQGEESCPTNAADSGAQSSIVHTDKAAVFTLPKGKAASVVSSPNRCAFLEVDDTVADGRSLDQTPRKAVRASSQRGGHKAAGEQLGRSISPQRFPAHKHAPRQENLQGSGRTGSNVPVLAFWVLLSCAILFGTLFGIDRWNAAPGVAMPLDYKTGPVCFRELYPGANGMVAASSSSKASTSKPSSWECALAKPRPVPFSWGQHPNCHVLDGLLFFDPTSTPTQVATSFFNESGGDNANDGLLDAAFSGFSVVEPLEPVPSILSVVGNDSLESESAMGVDASVAGQAASPDGYVPPLVKTSVGADGDVATEPLNQHGVNSDSPGRFNDLGSHLDTPHHLRIFNGPAEQPASPVDIEELTAPEGPAAPTDASAEQCAVHICASEVERTPSIGASMDDPIAVLVPAAEQPAALSDTAVGKTVSPIVVMAGQPDVSADTAGEQLTAPTHSTGVTHSLIDATPVEQIFAPVDSAAGEPVNLRSRARACGDTQDAALLTQTVWPTFDPVAETSRSELPPAVLRVNDSSTDGAVGPSSNSSFWRSLASKRLFSWTFLEFLFGVLIAGLAGALLAMTVEHLSPYMQHRQRTLRLDDSEAEQHAIQVRVPPVGRILRPKWPQGASTADGKMVADAIAVMDTFKEASPREGPGSLVWHGNKLVFCE